MDSPTGSAVFISYASQDAAAALRLCDALRAAGIEVWFDQAELGGGDGWDRKIRAQIATCALFVPVISAATQARLEGYFRLEWKLAAQRTHTMTDAKPFLLPVVIDGTRDAAAHVPEEFRAVQWTRLPDGAATPPFVERVKKLLAPVSAMEMGRPRPVERDEGAASPARQPAPPQASRRAAWAGALAVVVLGAGATFFATRKSEPASTSMPHAGAGTRPPTAKTSAPSPNSALPSPAAAPAAASVAVLAFANMSADKDTEYFSDGVSEEILNALDRIPALRVTPRTSSFSFKGKNVALDEIGRALRVASVIEGSVRKAGNRVRITVKLLNAADGTRVWTEDFDRDLTDIFAVQSEIAAKVAQKISGGPAATTTLASPAAAPTKNLAAHDAYLRGRAAQANPTPTGVEIVRHYEEAVRLDPDYAVAWARLSQALVRMFRGGYDRSSDTLVKARNAASAALRLNPDLPEGHLAMAWVRFFADQDFDATQRELDEAERLHPNNPEIPANRALLEQARGHWGEGLVALTARAVALDPLNGSVFREMGGILARTGRHAEAERIFVRSAELAPDSIVQVDRARNHLTWTGDVRRALDIMATAPESIRDHRLAQTSHAQLLAMNGEIAPAISAYEKVKADVAGLKTSASGPRELGIGAAYHSGQLEARRGNRERAAELYAEALAAALQYAKEYPDVSNRDLPVIRALSGERSEALAAMDDTMGRATRTRDAVLIANVRQTKAETLAILGETDAAVAELRAVHEMGFAFGYRLRRELQWEPLRGDAKFQQLMKEAEARADAQPRPKK